MSAPEESGPWSVAQEEFEFPGHAGTPIRGRLTAPVRTPDTGADRAPGKACEPNGAGLVLAHEVFGLDPFMDATAERLAQLGYVVLTPDLYSRTGTPGPEASAEEPAPTWTREQIVAAANGLPDRQATGDLEGALAHLAHDDRVAPDRLGLMGFCRGGTLALLTGCTSRRVSAVVVCYGRIVYGNLSKNQPTEPLEMTLNLDAPLLGLFGADDASIPAADVQALRERLEQFAKDAEVHSFDGAAHGFLNTLRPGWRPAAAERAWEQIDQFSGRAPRLVEHWPAPRK